VSSLNKNDDEKKTYNRHQNILILLVLVAGIDDLLPYRSDNHSLSSLLSRGESLSGSCVNTFCILRLDSLRPAYFLAVPASLCTILDILTSLLVYPF
jgi:hypothetical protein